MAQCTAFDGQVPSALEVQLGAKYATAVCSGNTILAPYTSQSTSAILLEETPYFTNPSPGTLKFLDVWAEVWEGTYGGGSILPFTDYVLQNGSKFGCVGTVLFALENYGKLPNAIGQSYPSYCPVVTDAEITPLVP
jgi:hypothetical protein